MGLDPAWCHMARAIRRSCAPVLKNSSIALSPLSIASFAYRATSAAAPTYYGHAVSEDDAVAWVKQACT